MPEGMRRLPPCSLGGTDLRFRVPRKVFTTALALMTTVHRFGRVISMSVGGALQGLLFFVSAHKLLLDMMCLFNVSFLY